MKFRIQRIFLAALGTVILATATEFQAQAHTNFSTVQREAAQATTRINANVKAKKQLAAELAKGDNSAAVRILRANGLADAVTSKLSYKRTDFTLSKDHMSPANPDIKKCTFSISAEKTGPKWYNWTITVDGINCK